MATTELYNDIEISTEVMTASGHRLIQMLLDKTLQQIQVAKKFVVENNLEQRNQALKKVSDIVSYLRSCLNFNDPLAKDLSTLLDAVYVFVETSVLNATLKNEVVYLDQAYQVIFAIKSGWDGIENKA